MPSNPEASVRLFEAPLLERLSKAPWWIVPTLYLPLAAGLLAWGLTEVGVSAGAALALFAAGLVVWSLTEYWLHRVVFHWRPRAAWGDRLHFLLHGVHHDYPFDAQRLVMPPAASLALGVAFFGLYWALGRAVGGTAWVWPLFAGKVVGYVHYDLTHYYVHHGRPRSRRYRRLRAHHNAHHHNPRAQGLNFGVSTTLWDRVFRTR